MSASIQITSLPFEGEYLHSPSKRHKEIVVFIHHFGGSKKTTRRHQKLILDEGYDCVIFNLYYHSFDSGLSQWKRVGKFFTHFLTFHKNFIHSWSFQLNEVLNQIPGQKILFSLSSPSTSVVGVLGHYKRTDIQGWVCDCGPFLDAWSCFRNYNSLLANIKNPFLLYLINASAFVMFGGIGYKARMKSWLSQFPMNFPVLSLRCEKDLLVPPTSIDKFFNISNALRIFRHTFKDLGHLEGIKRAPQEYRQVLVQFLQACKNIGNSP